MSLSSFAVRRPVAVAMAVLAAAMAGTLGLLRMPVSLLPDVAYPKLLVWTVVPEVGPAEVERHVTEPIEGALAAVPGVIGIESVSSTGQSWVSLRFPWGTDMDFARLHVRERLDHLAETLPPAAERPAILRLDPGAGPILIAAATPSVPAAKIGRTAALGEIERLAETVFRRRLEQLKGVGRVAIVGGAEREIRIEADPARLEARGLSVGDVTAALEAANASAPGGTVRRGGHRFALRVLGELGSLEHIERVVVARGEAGATVRLADVATVADTVTERDGAVYLDGRPAIGLWVYKESGANTVSAARRVETTLAEIEERHPSVRLVTVTSQAGFITAAIANVLWALGLGALLAGLVLFPFLGDPRWPAILGLAIPISVIAAFIPLQAVGVGLNVMSLAGLALGVGMLVDGSIVVLENVFRLRERGLAAETAAVRGPAEVQGAIFASTLTTIAVFGPVVFLDGLARALFGDLALAVAASLLASLVVALTAIPALAARLGAGDGATGTEPIGRRPPAFRRGLAGVDRAYRRLLAGALDQPRRVLVWTGAALAATIVIAPLLPRDLMPEVDPHAFTARITPDPGIPLEKTEALALDMDRWLRRQPEVEAVQTRLGRAAVGGFGALGEEQLDTAVLVVRLESRGSPSRAVMERLRGAFDHLPAGTLALEAGGSTGLGILPGNAGADLAIEIRGADLAALGRGAREVARRLEGLPVAAVPGSEVEAGAPEIRIALDREAVARHRLEPRAVVDALVDRTRGRLATRFVEFDRRVPVVVRAGGAERHDLDRILAGSVEGVPLRLLVRVEDSAGPTAIRHDGQERVARVTADVVAGDLAGAIDAVRHAAAGVELPEGVRLRVGGGAAELQRSFRKLALAFLLALLLIYMILAAQFDSLVLPLVVLLAVPLALIGAVLLLALTGNGFDTMSLIGIVVLAGIAVNNAIVMVDFIVRARSDGMPLRPAIEEAGRARLRPILMTSSTTILGLLPMALGWGSGSELRAPLAVAAIGGMVSSTALVLLIVPAGCQWVLGRRP